MAAPGRPLVQLLASLVVCIAGCGSGLWPARNCDPPSAPVLTPVAATETALLANETGVDDALWLQIERPHDAGVVGGYISPADEDQRGSLVLLLPGASTLDPGGRPELALDTYHDFYGQNFRDAGYRLWTLVLDEDEPYGDREVDQVIDVVAWLDREGREWLGVERVYMVGYSTGATAANVANLYVDVTAVVSISGLTGPEQLERESDLLGAIADLFPCNTGMRQMQVTLDAVRAGELGRLDVVSRVAELRNPTLFLHAEDDPLYFASNTHNLERAYQYALAAGADNLPELRFDYAPIGGHFAYVANPALFAPVLEHLETFEGE